VKKEVSFTDNSPGPQPGLNVSDNGMQSGFYRDGPGSDATQGELITDPVMVED